MSHRRTSTEIRHSAAAMMATTSWTDIADIMMKCRPPTMDDEEWDLLMYHLLAQAPPIVREKLESIQELSVKEAMTCR